MPGQNSHSGNNYYASAGTTTAPFNNQSSGLFGHDNWNKNNATAYSVADITDGTSNTIAFGEGLKGHGAMDHTAWRNDVAGATIPSNAQLLDAWTNQPAVLTALTSCNAKEQSEYQAHPSGHQKGHTWTFGQLGLTRFNTIVPPNSTQYPWGACATHGGTSVGDSQFVTASSNHPGGANMLFADGSVHFLKSTVQIRTYWALGTKADGEVISANQY